MELAVYAVLASAIVFQHSTETLTVKGVQVAYSFTFHSGGD